MVHLNAGYWLLDIVSAATYTALFMCAAEGFAHVFTWGVAVACIAGVFTSSTLDQIDEWDWFSWAKRISLVVGWLGYLLGWITALHKEGSAVHTCARRFLQLILMANVAEAAVLMLTQGNYVAGTLGLLNAMYSPDWSYIDDKGRLACEGEATILGCTFPCLSVSSRWYTRCYYVILSFCLCLHPRFREFWVFVYISCIWPLILQEVLPLENVGVIFKVRAFIIIAVGALMDTFINKDSLELSTDLPPPPWRPDAGVLELNLWSALVIALLFAVFAILDRVRGVQVCEAGDTDDEESNPSSRLVG